MARISFDNAEQMAVQAQLQATLSRINKKKEATDSEEVVSAKPVKSAKKSSKSSDDAAKATKIEAHYIMNVLKESIGNAEKLVFLYLCLIAKDRKAITSLTEAANATHIGRTCVSYSLNALYKAGWIDCRRVRTGKTWANSYTILKHFSRSESQNTDFESTNAERSNVESSKVESTKLERSQNKTHERRSRYYAIRYLFGHKETAIKNAKGVRVPRGAL